MTRTYTGFMIPRLRVGYAVEWCTAGGRTRVSRYVLVYQSSTVGTLCRSYYADAARPLVPRTAEAKVVTGTDFEAYWAAGMELAG